MQVRGGRNQPGGHLLHTRSRPKNSSTAAASAANRKGKEMNAQVWPLLHCRPLLKTQGPQALQQQPKRQR